MKFRTFSEWLKETRGEDLPEGNISAQWFVGRNIPFVVECAYCKMSMCIASDSVRIDEDGRIYCKDCAGE